MIILGPLGLILIALIVVIVAVVAQGAITPEEFEAKKRELLGKIT